VQSEHFNFYSVGVMTELYFKWPFNSWRTIFFLYVMFFIQLPLSCERIFFLHYVGNPRTQEDGYGKYRISNPSRKRRRRETDAQFKGSNQNSILNLIDTVVFLMKVNAQLGGRSFIKRFLEFV